MAAADDATGRPSISGRPIETVALDGAVGDISDPDGINSSTVAYAWLRCDQNGGNCDTTIGTASTYTLTSNEAGKRIRLQISFTDNADNAESRTSWPWPARTEKTISPWPACAESDLDDAGGRSVVWTGTMTVGYYALLDYTGYGTRYYGIGFHAGAWIGSISSDTSFSSGAKSYKFWSLEEITSATENSVLRVSIRTGDGQSLSINTYASHRQHLVDQVTLHVCNEKFAFSDASYLQGSYSFRRSPLRFIKDSTRIVRLSVPDPNNRATGKPSISGTATVGETLTAATTGIMDDDGLTNVSYEYQWVRVDADGTSNAADISDATSASYTLQGADQGKKIKVRVSFTDDADNDEELTSDAYPTSGTVAAANSAPTASNQSVTVVEDGTHAFAADEFGFSDMDTGDTLGSVTIATLPASGKGVLWFDGRAVTADASVTKAEIDAGKLTYKPPANAYGDGYATFTFKVSDGEDESAQAYTMTVNVTAVNDDPTGKPSISGTAAMGETLTASTTGIMDDDGLTNVSYEYQWVRVDADGTSNAADISDATSASYTLQGADQGKKIKVRVSFTDDADNDEELTSDAYPTSGTIDDLSGTLRLVDGEVEHEGRLEMYYGGQWGTICDDLWTIEEADVACRQLGYSEGSEGNASRYRRAYFGPGTGEIHLDDLRCTGSETSLLMCPRARNKPVGSHNCRHSEDVGVRCSAGSPRISGAPALSDAPGEDGRWGVGETLEVTVTFSEEVQVDTSSGTPGIEVRLGRAIKRRAVYERGSGAPALVFVYELETDDGTHAVAHVSGDSLALGGGRIRSKSSGRDAILSHAGASIAGEAATAPPLTAEFRNLQASHQGPGHPFKFQLHFSHEIRMSYVTVRDDLLSMRARVDGAKRVSRGSNLGWEITVSPISYDDIVITLPATTDCSSTTAVCTSTGQKLEAGISTLVFGLPAASVADAEVREGSGATLDFVVTLSRAVTDRVDAVRYRTADGTARAGQDYEARSGLVTFAPGATTRMVSIPVIDDVVDEGSETMRLELSTFSNGDRVGIRVADGTATGTIVNDDPMPKAWLARFGRTVAEQVLDAVESRLEAPRAAGVEASLAGQPIGGAGPSDEALDEALERREAESAMTALADWLRGETSEEEGAQGFESRAVSGRELLLGSSFALTGGSAETGFGALWGRASVSGFDGRDGDLTVDGEVTSAMLGADWTGGRATAGLALAHSRGEGSYRSPGGDGEAESTLTGLYPYGRYALSERVSLWGVAGYGAGTLTLKPGEGSAIETDLGLAMGALGLRGVVVEAPAEGGVELSVKTDAMAVRTTSDAARGEDGGNMAASAAEVTRLRLGLQATWHGVAAGGGTLTPTLEVGVRHDGGDAETGYGADIGAGLSWSDPERGISADVRARGLLAHEADGFSERGFSGTLAWDPAPSTVLGPSLTLNQTVGATSTGGADALLGRGTMEGLAAYDGGEELERRHLEAKLGYGFAVFDGRYTGTPELGLGLSETDREYVLGWRLAEVRRAGLVFGLDVEGARRERVVGGSEPGHRVGVGFGWRLEGTGTERFELRFEAARLDGASDDAGHRLGVRMRARW